MEDLKQKIEEIINEEVFIVFGEIAHEGKKSASERIAEFILENYIPKPIEKANPEPPKI